MNLIEELEDHQIPYREHQSKEDEIWICCPFCIEEGTTPDSRFRLGVNVVTGWMYCFNCGKKSKDKNYSFSELERMLQTGKLDDTVPVKVKKKKLTPVKLPDDFQMIRWGYKKDYWNYFAYEYLKNRGVTEQQVREKNIGYSLAGDFRYRIVIPVYRNGELKGLVGRAFVKSMVPPYKNSVGEKVLFDTGETQSGRKPRKRKMILVEGVFDAMAIERAINKEWDSGGVLGSSLTEKQLEQLSSYEDVGVWGDPDKAGIKGTMKIGRLLKEVGKRVWVSLPTKDPRDPDELTTLEIKERVREMVPYGLSTTQKLKLKLAFSER